jgi:DNA-binding NtrC family response regulator
VRRWVERSTSARLVHEQAAARREREVLFVHGSASQLRRWEEELGADLPSRFCDSGRAAFRQMFDRAPPAAVVSELVLPDLSGELLYRTAMRRDDRWAERFVFVTGQPPDSRAVRAIRSWSLTVHFQPYELVLLRRSIDAALRAATAASEYEVALVRHGGRSR